MNTESAALCCGNRPSTHRSGRPVLVCRSCGDQLQGETAEDTLQAWNRAKDPLGCAEARAADKLAADLREARARADANWHEGERLRGQLAKAEAELVKAQKAEAFAKAWSRKTSPGGAQ